MAWASYIAPSDNDKWDRLINSSKKLTVLVANVANGPSYQRDDAWKKVISNSKAAGKRILGYVPTGYLGIPVDDNNKPRFPTRLGTYSQNDWIAQIEQDIDRWYEFYGDDIGGIFFDEGYNNCDDANHFADIYDYVDRYTKLKHGDAFTVSNPGVSIGECYKNAVDTLLTFEQSYQKYANESEWDKVKLGWKPDDTRKIWHIVYNVTSEAQIKDVVSKAKDRFAGLLMTTDDTTDPDDNPYDTVPSQSYLDTLFNAVQGGEPLVAKKSWPSGSSAATPAGLQVASTTYTSVTLKWSAASNALGYNIYLDDKVILSVPPFMTNTTVVNRDPNTSYSFTITAIGGSGTESSKSSSVTAKTQALPDGKAIVKGTSSATETTTTVKADVLLPFNNFRVYLYKEFSTTNCQSTSEPTYPLAVDGGFACVRYLLEGNFFYTYKNEGDPANPPWFTGPAKVVPNPTKSGSTYTWQLPVGTAETDARNLVIQGYNSQYGDSLVRFEVTK